MVKQILKTGDRIARNRVVQHLLFWALSFLVLVNILKVSADIHPIDLIYTAIFHLPILLVTYANLQILFPFFLAKRRFVLYGILIAATIIGGWLFYSFLFGSWIDYILPGYFFIAYYNFWDIALYLAVYIASTSLIKLTRGWFRLQEIQKEKTLTELKALKSQINPHFLFNSLNNLYGLSRKASPVLPDAILRLSGLMRYVIYETDVEKIDLGKEIEVIIDYITLQRLRCSPDDVIEFETEGDTAGYKIAPLILLPLVENCFKHGLKEGNGKDFIKIRIEISGAVLNFETENNKGQVQSSGLPETKGIGIGNVRKRLSLDYPNAHLLKIADNGNIYKVLLQLQLA